MKKCIVTALLVLNLYSLSALALTLDEARSQGRVGETLNGYLAPISQDKETLMLVDRINKARTESYQQLAERNNIAIDDVAKMAGQKLVERARPGDYVQGINGKWLKKP
ncbi:YdbL family protein [Enterobacter sp. Bisph1]|uniref:YdbL family protein n=1 Tax=Enterobacter sp. Bisph1 TaxID=1274399 RepID=UPI00057BD46D|nr:YdbL family protein [Enterobacter sp. Bisph1]